MKTTFAFQIILPKVIDAVFSSIIPSMFYLFRAIYIVYLIYIYAIGVRGFL